MVDVPVVSPGKLSEERVRAGIHGDFPSRLGEGKHGRHGEGLGVEGGSLNRVLNTPYIAVTRIRIENVVASTSVSDELDLQSVALTLEGSEYEPEQFPGVIYRLEKPRTAILLFRSGKLVCTGGKSMRQVEESIRTVSELIRKGGQKVLLRPKTQVQNIVATSDLESEVNLNSIAITLGLDRVEYEPEQFPGLVCRLEEPRVVVLLFGSGKLVCTGARRPSDVALAVEKITKELRAEGLLGRGRSRTDAEERRTARTPRSSRPASVLPRSDPTPRSENSATARTP